jgi:hypothetical protein
MEVPAIIAQDKDEYQIESWYLFLSYIGFDGTGRSLPWDRSGRKETRNYSKKDDIET